MYTLWMGVCVCVCVCVRACVRACASACVCVHIMSVCVCGRVERVGEEEEDTVTFYSPGTLCETLYSILLLPVVFVLLRVALVM